MDNCYPTAGGFCRDCRIFQSDSIPFLWVLKKIAFISMPVSWPTYFLAELSLPLQRVEMGYCDPRERNGVAAWGRAAVSKGQTAGRRVLKISTTTCRYKEGDEGLCSLFNMNTLYGIIMTFLLFSALYLPMKNIYYCVSVVDQIPSENIKLLPYI